MTKFSKGDENLDRRKLKADENLGRLFLADKSEMHEAGIVKSRELYNVNFLVGRISHHTL